ncbi:hypothetical protein J2TS4_04730 [Paenibacillus sp. J2TS4]|nr:hypothetical protein J2TS4_04730 [Paenibacillus sp. J2TS4]
MDAVLTDWMPGMATIIQMEAALNDFRSKTLFYVLSTGEMEDVTAKERLEQIDNIQSLLASYEGNITIEEERTLYDQLIIRWSEYLAMSNQLVETSRTDKNEADRLLEAGAALLEKVKEVLDPLIALNWEMANQAGEQAQEEYRFSVTFGQVAIAVGLVIGLIVAGSLAKLIASPLSRVTRTMNEIASGNLAVEPIITRSRDESGQMAEAVNLMVEHLRTVIRQASEASEQVAASSQELAASAEQTAESSNDVAQSIQEMAEGAENAMVRTEEMSRAMEEMTIGIQKVAESAGLITDNSHHAEKQADQGYELAQQAVTQMKTIGISVKQLAEAIDRLQRRSDEIGQIVYDISAIAGRTNILSLNAAIEASRAGEEGRGFAVVAKEIRVLAAQSEQSAQRVSQLVEEIQGDTKSAVRSMEQGSRDVEEGTSIVNQAGEAFEAILEAIRRIGGQLDEALAVTEQMSAGSQQVLASVEQSSSIARESMDNAQTVAGTTEEQLAAVQEISASANDLTRVAQDLQDAISKFRLS